MSLTSGSNYNYDKMEELKERLISAATLKERVRDIIVDYLLENYNQYKWYESEGGEFELAVKLNHRLEGIGWSIISVCDYPKIKITMDVEQMNFLGEAEYISVDIDKWNLIPKNAKCRNTKYGLMVLIKKKK